MVTIHKSRFQSLHETCNVKIHVQESCSFIKTQNAANTIPKILSLPDLLRPCRTLLRRCIAWSSSVSLPTPAVRTALQAPDSAASQLAHTLRSLVGFPPDFDGSKPEPTSLYESRGQTNCGAVKLLISEFWNGIKKMHLNRRGKCEVFVFPPIFFFILVIT